MIKCLDDLGLFDLRVFHLINSWEILRNDAQNSGTTTQWVRVGCPVQINKLRPLFVVKNEVRAKVTSILKFVLISWGCAVTKSRRRATLAAEIYLLTVLEATGLRSRGQQGWLLLRPLSSWSLHAVPRLHLGGSVS